MKTRYIDNPERILREHILKGDSSDGIPNVLSADNCLVIGVRQKPMTAKRLDLLMGTIDDEETLRNYKRNEQLIDLSKIPESIRMEVRAQYEAQGGKGKSRLFDYFIANRLKHLMDDISDF